MWWLHLLIRREHGCLGRRAELFERLVRALGYVPPHVERLPRVIKFLMDDNVVGSSFVKLNRTVSSYITRDGVISSKWADGETFVWEETGVGRTVNVITVTGKLIRRESYLR